MNRSFVLLLVFLSWSSASSSDRWIRFRNKVYHEVTTPLRSPNLLAHCTAMAGFTYAVEVVDIVENNFVKLLNGGATQWIGVTLVSGQWIQWEGAEVSFTIWAVGRPSGQTAVVIQNSGGLWEDRDPTLTYPGVCQRELIPDKAVFVPLLTSAGSEVAMFTGSAASQNDCAAVCLLQGSCTCFGYNEAQRTCWTFPWQPVIQPGNDYFCFKNIMI